MRFRRLCRVAGLLVVVLSPPVVARPAEAADGFKPVGTLERFAQEATDTFPELLEGSPFESRLLNGTLLPVPQAGQLWQVYRSTVHGRSGVLVRDDKTLRVVGSFTIDLLLHRATVSAAYGGEWLHATDGDRRMFLVAEPRRLLQVDTSTLAVRELGELSATSPILGDSDSLVVAGLTYDRATGQLLVLYGGPANSVANRLTVLQQFDPATGTKVDRIVRSCTGPLPATDVTGDTLATVPLADTEAVYVPCQQGTFAPGLGLSSSSIVVRLPRVSLSDSAGDETSVVVGGPMDTAVPDPVAARFTVLDHIGRLTVVDARAMAVVGSFDASPEGSGRVGPGIDPTTGRVYFQSDIGLGFVEARRAPSLVPTVDPSSATDGQESIVAQGSRIYVLAGYGLDKAARYTIYKVAS